MLHIFTILYLNIDVAQVSEGGGKGFLMCIQPGNPCPGGEESHVPAALIGSRRQWHLSKNRYMYTHTSTHTHAHTRTHTHTHTLTYIRNHATITICTSTHREVRIGVIACIHVSQYLQLIFAQCFWRHYQSYWYIWISDRSKDVHLKYTSWNTVSEIELVISQVWMCWNQSRYNTACARMCVYLCVLRSVAAAPHQGVPGHLPWQKYLRPGCRPGNQKW